MRINGAIGSAKRLEAKNFVRFGRPWALIDKPMTPDDAELLRRFVCDGAKDAFGGLVQRHLGVVYHAALRQVGGDAHRAEEVAQDVFTLLARKAPALVEHTMLIGWLFAATRRTAWRLMRSEQRRLQREHVAWMINEATAGANEADWENLRPLLDEVVNQLKPAERDALLLRYFQEQPFSEIGQRFAVSEDAARMRVERALEKLRARLVRRGVTSTSAALALLLANNAVAATPSGLATSITTAVLTKAVAGGGFAILVTKLFLMTKTQVAVLGGLLALLAVAMTWQWQANTEIAQQYQLEQRRSDELERSVLALQKEIAEAKGTRPLTLTTTLTPEQQEKKRQRLLTSRKLFDSQYAALYRRLHLPPVELEKFKDLLAEREWEAMVELSFARKSGLDEMRNIETRQFQAAANVEGNERIRAFLGEANYAYFEHYDQSATLRNLFSRFTDELELLGAPMSDEQMDKFAELANTNMREGMDKWREGGGPAISEEMMAKAAGFMTPRQMERLKAAQEEFDARIKIAVLNRTAAEQGKVTVTEHMSKYYPKCPVDRD